MINSVKVQEGLAYDEDNYNQSGNETENEEIKNHLQILDQKFNKIN